MVGLEQKDGLIDMWTYLAINPPPTYYIKADPKSIVAGLKFSDISWCFVKFGLSEELPHLIWQNFRPFH